MADLELAEKEKMKEKVEMICKHDINVFINRQLIYNYPEQLFADKGKFFLNFLTAILHRGLRNDFFFRFQFKFYNFYWTFFPCSTLTFVFLFNLDFYLTFLFGLFFYIFFSFFLLYYFLPYRGLILDFFQIFNKFF